MRYKNVPNVGILPHLDFEGGGMRSMILSSMAQQ